jgi:hypothetical protein
MGTDSLTLAIKRPSPMSQVKRLLLQRIFQSKPFAANNWAGSNVLQKTHAKVSKKDRAW